MFKHSIWTTYLDCFTLSSYKTCSACNVHNTHKCFVTIYICSSIAYMVGNGGTTPNSPSLVLALIDVLVVVQSHIMWRWSTANSHNWTSCFLFSPLLACFTVESCFSVVYCCTYSFVSGHTAFFPSSLILYFIIWPLGCDFVQIKSYHIISYHIISYHIISYHIIFK